MIKKLIGLNPWAILAALVALAAFVALIDARGYNRGHAAATAASAEAQAGIETKLAARNAELNAAQADFEAALTARSDFIERLEYEALQAPSANGPALSSGSVRRLRARWQD